jgi:hypothetical protein
MTNLNTKTLINESIGLVCKGSSMVKQGASMYLSLVLKYADKKLIDKVAKSKLTKDANAVVDSGFDNMPDEIKDQTRTAFYQNWELDKGEKIPVKIVAGKQLVPTDDKPDLILESRLAWSMAKGEYSSLSATKGDDRDPIGPAKKEFFKAWRESAQDYERDKKRDLKNAVKSLYAKDNTESGSSVEVLSFTPRLIKGFASFVKLYRNGIKNGDKLNAQKAEKVETLINELDKVLNS